jgi:hypothetical protein
MSLMTEELLSLPDLIPVLWDRDDEAPALLPPKLM